MLIDKDTPYCHGIAICDEQGAPLPRVQKFCTETYMCWMPNGKRTVAAAYAIFPVSQEVMRRCTSTSHTANSSIC